MAEQKRESDFPGKQVMTEAIREIANGTAWNEESAFYDWISREKENLLDLAEELAPVKTFYSEENNQRKIFKENGLDALRLYESSKEHINDSELGKVVENIQRIVKDKADSLCKRYLEQFSNMEIRPQSTKISYPTEARQRGADIIRETSEEWNVPIQKRTKNLMAKDVASGHWVIRDKEELNRYLELLFFQGFCNIFVDFCDIIAYNKNR